MSAHATSHAPAAGHDAAHGHSPFGHVAQPWQLLAVFGSLLVLTFLTVWVSRGPIDFGWVGLAIAMLVASAKAAMVMLFFMHMIHDRPFNVFAFLAGYLFLGLFMFFVLMDSSQYSGDVDSYTLKNPRAALPAPAPGRMITDAAAAPLPLPPVTPPAGAPPAAMPAAAPLPK
jgi:cytochrome c oxidase subunit IV